MKQETSKRPAVLFLAATAISTVGSALGALESTYVATESDPDTGTYRTALMLTVLLISAALTVPQVPRWASRWGYQRLYTMSTAGTAVVWGAAGVGILAGLPAYLTLMLTVPFMGVSTGMATVLAPLFGRAYMSGETMAGAYARLSVILGLSWGAGSIIGGQLFQSSPPGVGVTTRAVLTVPLAIVLATVRPQGFVPSAHRQTGGAWRALMRHVRTPSPLRTVIVLSAAVAIFALPYLSLIVPITSALRQAPLVEGAGLLMAGTSVGEVFSPLLVSRLQRRLPSLPASAAAAMACAACLLTFAVTSFLLTDETELIVWTAIGVAFGASRYAMKSLELDAAVTSDVEDGEAVATVSFTKTALAPVGLLLWSSLMTLFSVEAALLVSCVGLSLGAGAAWMSYTRRRDTPLSP